MRTNQMTMLIFSCDAFSDLWDGQVRLLERNWPDRGMRTVIVTDKPTQKRCPPAEIFAAGADAEWSDRLALALKTVETEYVFVTLDDYYLTAPVSNASIEALLEMMEAEGLDYVRLFKRPKSATRGELSGYPGVFAVNNASDYSVNLYAGIWKRAFLEQTVRAPKNAWQFEVSLPKRAREYGAKCAVSLRGEYPILDVVRKGKLLHRAAFYFKRHPGIYTGARQVNTWGYEIRLTLQQQVSRHLPKPVFYALKAFLRRRGMHFYSDDAE